MGLFNAFLIVHQNINEKRFAEAETCKNKCIEPTFRRSHDTIIKTKKKLCEAI